MDVKVAPGRAPWKPKRLAYPNFTTPTPQLSISVALPTFPWLKRYETKPKPIRFRGVQCFGRFRPEISLRNLHALCYTQKTARRPNPPADPCHAPIVYD